jgi:lipopolysaccharide assembly protein A
VIVERAKLIGAIVVAVIALIVMVQNRESAETYFLFWSFSMPRAILLLLTFGLGVGTGYLLFWRRSIRRE